jgi:RNA polymerase sigma factor (sigma-70 family)
MTPKQPWRDDVEAQFLRQETLTGLELAVLWAAIDASYGRVVKTMLSRRFGLSGADVDDLWQETLLIAFERPWRFDPKRGRLLSWLKGIARHRAKKHLEDAAKRAGRASALRAVIDPTTDGRRSAPLEVDELLERLPLDEAALLRGHFVERRTFDELAAARGRSRSSIQKSIAKILAKLRKGLGESRKFF